MRTKHRSPKTNGVIERFYESVRYEHLYRLDLPNGQALGQELELHRTLFNGVRPHESLDSGPRSRSIW